MKPIEHSENVEVKRDVLLSPITVCVCGWVGEFIKDTFEVSLADLHLCEKSETLQVMEPNPIHLYKYTKIGPDLRLKL